MIEVVMKQYATLLTGAAMDANIVIMKTYDSDTLTMPDVDNYRFGDTLDPQTLPCAIITARETAFTLWTQGKEDALHTIAVAIAVADTDPVRLEKLIWRYAQAASMTLQAGLIGQAGVVNFNVLAWEYGATILGENKYISYCTIVTEAQERIVTYYT